MRTAACIVFLTLLQPAFGQARLEIISKAISAHGGTEALGKLKAYGVTMTGKMNISGTEVMANREGKLALPDRMVWNVTFKFGGIDRKSLLGLNGLSGWQQIQNQTSDMDSTIYDEVAEEAYMFWLTTLTPLSQKAFTLSDGPKATVNNKPAIGVKVARAGKPDVVLYFSEADALFVKAQFAGKTAGVPTYKEFIYADHKSFEGVKLPIKIIDLRDNTRAGEWTVTNYRFVDKYSPEEFKKPAAK